MTVQVALIGLGHRGTLAARTFTREDATSVVAGVDPDPEARKRFETAFSLPTCSDYAELLSTEGPLIDAVVILSPHVFHESQAIAALNRNEDVFLEKPMATTVEDARRIVEAANASEGLLDVGYQRRLDPVFQRLKQVVSERIGELHTVSACLSQRWQRPNADKWRTNPAISGGGQLSDTGSHIIELVLWLTEGTPAEVSGTIDRRGTEVDVNTAVSAAIKTDGRTVTTSIALTGAGTSIEPTETISCFGTEGHVVYTGEELRVEITDGRSDVYPPTQPSYEDLSSRRFERFVDAVDGGSPPLVTGEEALGVVAFSEAVYEAAATGRSVDVREEVQSIR